MYLCLECGVGKSHQQEQRNLDNGQSAWNQLGNTLDGIANHEFGVFIALSSDGKTVALISGSDGTDNRLRAGYVYRLSSTTGDWEQLGDRIQEVGQYISLSSNGEIVALGKHYEGLSTGFAHVYQYNTQITVCPIPGTFIV